VKCEIVSHHSVLAGPVSVFLSLLRWFRDELMFLCCVYVPFIFLQTCLLLLIKIIAIH
jgi:hypothetical protein